MSAMVIQQCYRKYLSLCRAEEQLQKILVLQVSIRVLIQIIFNFKLYEVPCKMEMLLCEEIRLLDVYIYEHVVENDYESV